MPLSVETIFVLVPADWDVPGAGPIPTIPNKNFAEGRLEALPIGIDELATAAPKLPGAIFEAEGNNGAGGSIGVRVGVYDTAGGDPIALVRDAVGRLAPNAAVNPTTVCGLKGIRTLLSGDNGPGDGTVVCDYWARTRGSDTCFIVLRCWRSGTASPDDEEIFDDVAGSLIYDDGGSFTAPLRAITLRRYAPPPESEVVEPGRYRYIGWRLGKVFHTKMIAAGEEAVMTEMGARWDALLLAAVVLAWVAATVVLVGVGPILLLGAASAAGTLPELRSRGTKAVLILAVVLAALLAYGVVNS
jgi:hypothetical protein